MRHHTRLPIISIRYSLFPVLPYDAAEPDMAGRGVDRLGVAGSRPVAAAVVGRAQEGAALEHLARNPDVGLARIVARVLRPAARVPRDAAGLGGVGLVLCG